MTDSRVTKIIDGNYTVGRVSVLRAKGKWLVTATGRETEVYRTHRRAVLAALIISGYATDAEVAAFAEGAE